MNFKKAFMFSATLTSLLTPAASFANTALQFGGTTDYVSIPHAAVSGVTTYLTLEAMVKPSTATMTGRIIDNITRATRTGSFWTF